MPEVRQGRSRYAIVRIVKRHHPAEPRNHPLYVEGQNIAIEYRSADGKIDRLPRLAAELARLKVDLIVVGSTPSARAAQQATTTIPLVAWAMADPVGDGLAASLARPGGISRG